jgi:hypothetical protein
MSSKGDNSKNNETKEGIYVYVQEKFKCKPFHSIDFHSGKFFFYQSGHGASKLF